MLKAKSILLFLLVVFFEDAYSQLSNYDVRGKVVDTSQVPLQAATIILADNEGKEVAKAVTDSMGNFLLTVSKKGSYKLSVSYTGYEPYISKPFNIEEKIFEIIQLKHLSSLEEVKVNATKNVITVEGGTIIYNVAKSVTAQGATALDVLKQSPGVFVENETAITLNGKGGTLILLDGKQTYLSGRELIDLLKGLPSSSIKSINITANPGGKYDAAGSGGVIDIKTIKSGLKGFSSSITTGLAYGITLRQSQDLSLHYKKDNWSFYGSYNHILGHNTYEYGSDRKQAGRTYNSFTDDTDKRNKMSSRLGVDYSINKQHTVGLLVTGNFVFGGGLTQTKTSISKNNSADLDQTLDAANDYYYQKTERYNVNANYRYENEKGVQWNVDLDWGSFNKGNASLQPNAYFDANSMLLTQYRYRSFNDIDVDLKAVKVDYTKPLWKGTLETGLKFSDIQTANGAQFLHVLASYDSLDDRRSNTFNYKEQIQSGYLTYKKSKGRWSFTGSLRVEKTISDGTLFLKTSGVDTTNAIRRSYTDLFPSFSISLKQSKNHNLSLVYARRIDRPAYQDLNPFIFLLDELSFWQGNPFLQPQLTHRLALQWLYKSSTVLSLTYANTDAFAARITDTLEGTKIVMIPRNLGIQKHLSLSLTHNVVFMKGWEGTLNGVLFRLHNKIAFDAARNLELKQLAGRINFQQRFKLPYQFGAELTTYYSSRRITSANEISRGTSGIDIGLQKQVLKTKGTLRLVFSDIYKGIQFRSEQRFDGFYLNNYGYYESRQLRLNFTYRFADNGGKGPRSRTSGLESEHGRIK